MVDTPGFRTCPWKRALEHRTVGGGRGGQRPRQEREKPTLEEAETAGSQPPHKLPAYLPLTCFLRADLPQAQPWPRRC